MLQFYKDWHLTPKLQSMTVPADILDTKQFYAVQLYFGTRLGYPVNREEKEFRLGKS